MERPLFTSQEIPSGYANFRRISDRPGTALLLTGPNGVGKGSITVELLADPSLKIKRALRYASRPIGDSEQQGREYQFVTHEEFVSMVDVGQMIEHSSHGMGFYGTGHNLLNELSGGTSDLLFDIEAHATFALRGIFRKVAIPYADVLLSPVPVEQLQDTELVGNILRRRISGRRRGENETEIARRLFYAMETYRRVNEFTHVVVNKDGELAEAVVQVRKLLTTQPS
ncbi:MAG: hypothetical protein M3Q44_00755 [bacterium]|nr:hypothetical protein [bacterium]